MRFGLTVLLVLSIFAFGSVFASCGKGASPTANGLKPTGDHSGSDGTRSASVEKAIADALAYEPPEEIAGSANFDPLVFEMLRREFVSQIKLAGERAASYAPTGDAGRVKDLAYNPGTGMLTWSYTNIGDYDSSGEVGIPDITMIAQHYLANTSDGQGEDELESWIDGDGSGEVGISDITMIAQGYLNEVQSYRIMTSEHFGEGYVACGDDVPMNLATGTPLKLTAQLPLDANTFVVVAPVDGDGAIGEESDPVIFASSIFRNVPADTIFLYAPMQTVKAGQWIYVFICANVELSKPLSGFTARILVNQQQLNATEVGCMARSDTNTAFQNLFAEAMANDATSYGDILYPGFYPVDFWKGFADQEDVTLIGSPALPQPTFVDVGIYWDYRGNFLEKSGTGILGVAKLRAIGTGTVSLSIQGRDSEDNVKTKYTDLEANDYEFASIGAPINVNISQY